MDQPATDTLDGLGDDEVNEEFEKMLVREETYLPTCLDRKQRSLSCVFKIYRVAYHRESFTAFGMFPGRHEPEG